MNHEVLRNIFITCIAPEIPNNTSIIGDFCTHTRVSQSKLRSTCLSFLASLKINLDWPTQVCVQKSPIFDVMFGDQGPYFVHVKIFLRTSWFNKYYEPDGP